MPNAKPLAARPAAPARPASRTRPTVPPGAAPAPSRGVPAPRPAAGPSRPTVTPRPAARGKLPPRIQRGPEYYCPDCGAPLEGLRLFPVNPANPSPIDEWYESIAYPVRGHCHCVATQRFAKLGDCILPLELPNDPNKEFTDKVYENIDHVRAALEEIARAVPEEGRVVPPVEKAIRLTLARVWSPTRAAAFLNALISAESAEQIQSVLDTLYSRKETK